LSETVCVPAVIVHDGVEVRLRERSSVSEIVTVAGERVDDGDGVLERDREYACIVGDRVILALKVHIVADGLPMVCVSVSVIVRLSKPLE
jgi:hypothetical protein